MQRLGWDADVERMKREWAARADPVARPADPRMWDEQLGAMQAEMDHFRAEGQWAAGPHDLMSIVGLHRWELAHSAAVAWLCTPDAGHGLGSSFLRRLLEQTGGPVSLTGPVTTVLEESRTVSLPPGAMNRDVPPVVTATDPDLEGPLDTVLWLTRADVVVRGSGWTLVIEVKVDAVEGTAQARRLYEGWKDEPDVRFLFLTRSGGTPLSMFENPPSKWTCLAWRDLRVTLEGLAATSNPTAIARPALLDYLRTLRSTF